MAHAPAVPWRRWHDDGWYLALSDAEKQFADATHFELGEGEKDWDKARRLVADGGVQLNVTGKYSSGESALHWSIYGGAPLWLLRFMVEDKGGDVHVTANLGYTPLHTACGAASRHHLVAYLVVNAKARVDVKGRVVSGRWLPLPSQLRGSLTLLLLFLSSAGLPLT